MKSMSISGSSSTVYDSDDTATFHTTVHFFLLKITPPAAGDSQPLARCHSNHLHFGIHIKLWLPT